MQSNSDRSSSGAQKARFEAPKGTRDVLPAELAAWRRVLDEAEKLCSAYGYKRIITPTFEETALFARSAGNGSDVSKEMYTFPDQSGRSLTLRPEGTAQVCRMYVEQGLSREAQPVKTWMVAPMFRYAKPQKGRYREFWQLNVEAIGSDDPAIDAELIILQATWLGNLGITSTLLLNSIGCRACRPTYIAELEAWLNKRASLLDAETLQKRRTSPLRVFDTKNLEMVELLAGAPSITDALCDDCLGRFEDVKRYLDASGVAYTLEPRLVRGLDYYTRTAFEFVIGSGAQDTVSAGGRYDYLVEEIGGPSTPAVGFAGGIERIVQAAELGLPLETLDVFFACDPAAPREQVFALVGRLRAKGIRCDLDYQNRSLKGQLTQAKRLGAKTVVVAGDTSVILRRRDRPDQSLPYGDLEEVLSL